MQMINVLVLCTGNSCRSQMAEGYIRKFGNGNVNVSSAGIEAHGVNPKAIRVMAEDGINISNHTSVLVDNYQKKDFDYIITVCDHARENCPYFPAGGQKLHHDFPDPAKASGSEVEIMDEFRKVRDMIKSYSREFVDKLLVQ